MHALAPKMGPVQKSTLPDNSRLTGNHSLTRVMDELILARMNSTNGDRHKGSIPSRGRCAVLFLIVCVFFLSANGESAEAKTAANAESRTAMAIPYPTGSHRQLVRKFYSTMDGLPADEVQAVALTREKVVLMAGSNVVARLDGDRWRKETGLSAVTALFAPARGPEAFAGATNGVWSLSGDHWEKEEGSPERVIAFAAEPDGTPWALAPSGVWRRTDRWARVNDTDDDEMFGGRSLLPLGPDDVLIAARTGLFGLAGKRKYWLSLEVRPDGLLSTDTRAVARLDRDHFLVATDKGLNVSDGGRGWHAFTGADGLPILDLTSVVTAHDGTVWLGSNDGLVRWQHGRWIYLAGGRWLPDNRVTAIAPAHDGSVWVGTPKGLSHVYHRTLTLEEKAAILQKNLESRDRRYGYVTELQLRAPGVVEGAMQEISDNDGLWTSLYIAAQSFRYAMTKAPQAHDQAWRSTKALLRLESLTGLTGFPARAVCNVDEPQFKGRSLRSDSEWHESPVERNWFWKGETSSDEIDGHYFGWYLFSELVANDQEKAEVRATCKRVTDHILDHGYYLMDLDGKPTTWGVWAPEKLNDDPKWWHERGLNSLEILSHLKVAMHLVGDPRYEQAYHELIQKHHYAINALGAKIAGGVSHDNQLMFLAYYPLLQLEHDPGLRALYLASLRRSWEYERIEGNPLWNFIYGASTAEACDVEAAVEALREIPLDFIRWKTRNAQRADLKYAATPGRDGKKQVLKPLPWTEAIVHNWDSNPFEVDGGNDLTEADQTVWLLPYWMGRYHRLIE